MSESGLQSKWSLVKLADCARIVSGATPSTSETRYWNGDINWVTPKDISDLDGYPFLDSTPRTLTAEGLASCSAEILPRHSVLLSSRAPIGLVAINRIPVATNQGFKSFVPDTSRLDSGFLYHWLRANRSFLENLGTGATFKEVSKAVMTRVEIPLPPLDEQKRIAAVLDQADALRRQRQESLQLIEKLIESVFLNMFGDAVSNTKGWPTESLTTACKLSSGGTPSKSNASFWEGDLPWFTPKDLKRDELADSIDHVSASVLTHTNLKLYPAETVLIVVRGMILAHTFPVSIIKKAGVVNQDIKALTPVADMHPQFLAACLRAQRSLILSKVTTAGHGTKKLDTESLDEIRVFLPPMNLQMEFVGLVNRHRELLANGLSSKNSIASLFSSLQQRAFRGELDLSKVKLNPEELNPAEKNTNPLKWLMEFFTAQAISQPHQNSKRK